MLCLTTGRRGLALMTRAISTTSARPYRANTSSRNMPFSLIAHTTAFTKRYVAAGNDAGASGSAVITTRSNVRYVVSIFI